MKTHLPTSLTGAIATVAITALLAVGCGSDGESDGGSGSGSASASEREDVTLSLVAFSTPREAYEELIPMFQETAEGKGIEFQQSYGSSGEQSRAVEGGLPTDFVHLSLDPDVTRLVDAGLVADDWNDGDDAGPLTQSTVVFAVRKGNPKGIEDWDDLLDEDLEIVTPNPFTSGGARWNLMAAYGAWTRAGDSHEEALDKLEQLLRNTPVQSKSAREALQVFAAGKGDVMLAYEQEAIIAKQQGQEIDYVLPESTIRIDNPAAVLSGSEHAEEAQAFHDFLLGEEAQEVFASYGYRSVIDSVNDEDRFPTPKDLFTIDDVGGWEQVMTDFFDREDGAVATINENLGVPTDG